MRILFVHSGADIYGASRCCVRLACRLKADGHEVRVVLPFEGPMRNELERGGVGVAICESMSLLSRKSFKSVGGFLALPFRVIRSTLFVRRQIREMKADLVHSNTGTVFLCGGLAARLCRIPHVWHVREDFGDFGTLWKIYQWCFWAFSDRILGVTEFVTQQFKPAVIRKKIRVIFDGFPSSEFVPQPEADVRAFRKRFGLDGHQVVGLVGRINTFRKGPLTFVEAAKIVHDAMPDVLFLLVGSPFPGNEDHLVAVQNKIRELKLDRAVICTGDIDNVRVVYQSLDVLVQASGMPESFGGVVVEAMTYSVPVVATKIGGVAEVMAGEEAGPLVPPNDPPAMAEALLRLLHDENLRRETGRRGRARFERLFEFEAPYKKLLALYAELAR